MLHTNKGQSKQPFMLYFTKGKVASWYQKIDVPTQLG